MSKLEELVPPLDLCHQIPDGAFADSALIWHVQCSPVVYLVQAWTNDTFVGENEDNPATAALKLWLELNERKEENA